MKPDSSKFLDNVGRAKKKTKLVLKTQSFNPNGKVQFQPSALTPFSNVAKVKYMREMKNA